MKKYRGFTMIELVITLAIAAIIAGLAVPSFSQMIKNNRRDVRINQILNTLTLARSEAIKRGVAVTACKSANGTSCGGSGWESGWLMFVNNDDDGATIDVGEDILRVYESLPAGITLRSANFTNFITYRPDGFSNNNGNFVLCDDRGISYAKKIVVSKTGRGRIDSAAVTSCP